MKISYCKLWVFIITKFYRFHKTPCDPCVVTTMIHTIFAIMNAFTFQPDGISFVWSTRKQCSAESYDFVAGNTVTMLPFLHYWKRQVSGHSCVHLRHFCCL